PPFHPFHSPCSPTSFPLSLHDALPICLCSRRVLFRRPHDHRLVPSSAGRFRGSALLARRDVRPEPLLSVRGQRAPNRSRSAGMRSEEHTSELQSRFDLVCRLLLEKKK